ncbi:MAG TPA: anti-sigma factor [Terriglobia bacterium]|nr:anti-sigma factor [Terriglobia bacterium]
MRHSQLTDDLQERASLYAAGALPESERMEYARHIDEDQCVVCRNEVDELQAVMAFVASDVPPASPSPSVKIRLLEQARGASPVRPRPSFLRQRWLELITSAAAVAALVVLGAAVRANNELQHLADVLASRISQLEVEVSQQRTYIATVTAPDVRIVNLAGLGTNVGARGRIFWDQANRRWVFTVRNLQPLPANLVYQLWYVPKGGKPVSAAVFTTNADGSYDTDLQLREGLADLGTAAVTPEPGPSGLDQPTGQFALLGAAE